MQLHIKCVDRCESVPSGTTEISTVKNADGSTQVNEHLWLKTSCGRVYFLDLDSTPLSERLICILASIQYLS